MDLFKRFLVTAAAVIVALAVSQTLAPAAYDRDDRVARPITYLSAQGMDTSQAFTIDNTGGWHNALIIVDYTNGNTGTLTLTCTGADGIATTATITVCVVASGTCTVTSSGVFTTASLSADFKYQIRLGIGGLSNATCTFTHSATEDATDILTVTGVLYK